MVIAKHENTELIIVIPLTSQQDTARFPNTIPITKSEINKLESNSIALIFQIRAISIKRFERKIGDLEDDNIEEIKMQIVNYLKLEE